MKIDWLDTLNIVLARNADTVIIMLEIFPTAKPEIVGLGLLDFESAQHITYWIVFVGY